jgi:hypothetical protein
MIRRRRRKKVLMGFHFFLKITKFRGNRISPHRALFLANVFEAPLIKIIP